jgi:uncharacterized phage-like protein YoqJ
VRNREVVELMAVDLRQLGEEEGELGLITGMALGIDQLAAQAALSLGIKFTAAIPFRGQERRWPKATQEEYAELLSFAHKVIVVSDKPSIQAFHTRNIWMVDHADLVWAWYDGSAGGTRHCVEYAESKNVAVRRMI